MDFQKILIALNQYLDKHAIIDSRLSKASAIEIDQISAQVPFSCHEIKAKKSKKRGDTNVFEDIQDTYIVNKEKTMEVDTLDLTLEQYVQDHKLAAFSEMLFMLIDEAGLTDPQVYKRAQIDRKHFSKIRTGPDYRPSKSTALALALALHLPTSKAEMFIETAGYALSKSDTSDLIIRFCLEQEIYDLIDVNLLLDEFNLKAL